MMHVGRSEELQDILQARSLCVDEAIDSPDLAAWIDKYTQSSTLLTKEELAFSQTINTTRSEEQARTIVTDEAFEEAISSLQASTANIEKQCTLLEEHRKALASLRSQQSQSDKSKIIKESRQKNNRDRAQLELENDHLVAETNTQLGDHNRKVGAILGNAPNNIMKALERDDRILDGLEKIVPRLELSSGDERLVTPEAVDALCGRWTTLERQAMRRRIDDAYTRALNMSSATSSATNGTAEERAVRTELTELSSEVDGLITLVAEHHYRTPIQRSLAQARKEEEAASAKWSEYAACVLLFITAQLEALHELYDRSYAHRAALTLLESELGQLLSVKPTMETPDKPRGQWQSGRGLKPLRLVQATLNDSQETTAQICQLLDLRGVTEGVDQSALRRALTEASHERLAADMKYLHDSGGQQARDIARSIGLQDEHLFQPLYKAMEQTRDGAQRTRLADFEGQTDDLARKMQAVDVDSIARQIVV